MNMFIGMYTDCRDIPSMYKYILKWQYHLLISTECALLQSIDNISLILFYLFVCFFPNDHKSELAPRLDFYRLK